MLCRSLKPCCIIFIVKSFSSPFAFTLDSFGRVPCNWLSWPTTPYSVNAGLCRYRVLNHDIYRADAVVIESCCRLQRHNRWRPISSIVDDGPFSSFRPPRAVSFVRIRVTLYFSYVTDHMLVLFVVVASLPISSIADKVFSFWCLTAVEFFLLVFEDPFCSSHFPINVIVFRYRVDVVIFYYFDVIAIVVLALALPSLRYDIVPIVRFFFVRWLMWHATRAEKDGTRAEKDGTRAEKDEAGAAPGEQALAL